ncbi:unnamed protein product, partial [Brassica rapa subsp. trilocularis]
MRLLNHGDQILAVRYEALTCPVFLYIKTELIQTQKDPSQTTTAKRSSDDGDEIERRWRRDRATMAKRSSYDGDSEEIKQRRRRDRATTVTKSSDDGDEIECIPRSRRDRVMTVKSSKNHKLTTAILTMVTLTKTTRKRSSLSLVMTSLWKEHPVTTNSNHTIRFKISSQKMWSTPHDSPLHDSPLHDSRLHDSPLHDSPLHDSHLHDSLQLDSNEFCTTLKLPGRVYEAVETPDNPKVIIHYSKIDYIEKVEDILGKEEFSLIE